MATGPAQSQTCRTPSHPAWSQAEAVIKESETKIVAEVALRAYQTIIDRGIKTGTSYAISGIQAQTDYDGYSIMLTDNVVTVRILFHNKLAIDTPNGRSLARFRKRLDAIANP